jgi:hypothetical protein
MFVTIAVGLALNNKSINLPVKCDRVKVNLFDKKQTMVRLAKYD